MRKKFNEIINVVDASPQDEPWMPYPKGGILFVRQPNNADVETIYALTKSEISASTVTIPVIKAVYKHNKNNLWGVYQATDASKADARLIGYCGLLLLNHTGHETLKRGEFNPANPDLSLLAPGGTIPAAIYIWAVVAKRAVRLVTPLIALGVGSRVYAGLSIYGTAATAGGLNFLKNLGFACTRQNEAGIGGMLRFDLPPLENAEAA